jgi:dimeric dUTPase (all-alpha-NTP-PPase superfamily)
MVSTHKELLNKLNEMEKTYDEQFRIVFEAIRELMIPPDKPRKRIGFELKEGNTSFGKRAGI